MAKLYREEQKYHDIPSIAVLTLVGIFISYKLIVQIFTQQVGEHIISTGILISLLLLGIALVWNLRLKVRISRKKMTINLSPLSFTKLRLPKNEIEGIEFFKVTEGDLCSGWALHFGTNVRIFNFGDHSGCILHCTSGKKVIVFSNQIFQQREELNDLLEKNGWNILANTPLTS